MKLKVCGMKYPENIKLISELGPDFMGFIFYKNSKRYIDKHDIPTINKNIKKVGVAGHPEGSPDIKEELLDQAIIKKNEFAQNVDYKMYLATQFFFEASIFETPSFFSFL